MFGKNEIVGKKYFDKAGDKLLVTSIFYTLQGEGPYRGQPAVFVRLAKCNLACSFCDTYFDGGDWLTIEQLDQRINNVINLHYADNPPHWATYDVDRQREMVLVLTGGEPMLQNNIVPLLQHFERQFMFTQIESNGTQWQKIPASTTLVVSPKCLEKNGKAVKYLTVNPNVLQRADCLKFVMSADQDSPYSQIPDWALDWKETTGGQIFISPMNIYNKEPQRSKDLRSQKNDISIEERSAVDEVISFWEPGLLDMKQNQANHEYTAKYCMNTGCIFNMQLHLFASLA